MGDTTAPTWVFTREQERVEITRSGPTEMSIERPDTSERLNFGSAAALLEYQAALERRLLAAGWRFAGFIPERRHEARRTRHERRAHALQFPKDRKTEAADS